MEREQRYKFAEAYLKGITLNSEGYTSSSISWAHRPASSPIQGI